MNGTSDETNENDIAIIGMSIRVPGATTPESFWQNLISGREMRKKYSEEELLARGVSRSTLADPNYVRAGMPLEKMDHFDPEFFGFSQKEAAILDPQHRQFYETSWEAIERAGHPPKQFDGAIGIFAGCGMAGYFARNLLTNQEMMDSVGLFLLRHTGNDKDFLATRVSYLFDLKGPSVNVQTACSTSLVATHMAAQSLLSGECDMALAGGVTIEVPHALGYLYKEGEVLSPDGHCRPFDHRSKGTVFGSGTGVVVLRRLADALEDGDHIHAVIKGSAINNDGSSKVGYLAPSVEGQAAAVAEALAVADIDADSLGYVECHGTATPVGDPIEIAALTNAFRESSEREGFCKIGSVKSNIGHLDTAAGVASLIKAALVVEHGKIPPSLNYEAPNPNIAFEGSPFSVAADLSDWQMEGPRRAGVNSLGVGGTNAFVVLEEPPPAESAQVSAPAPQFLTISGRNRKAVDAGASQLVEWLRSEPERSLEEVSYTLAAGRELFDHRRVIACSTTAEAADLLEQNDARRVFNHVLEVERPRLVFMFPGGGAQYFQMGRDLYTRETAFREHMDRGLRLLQSKHGVDLGSVFHADDDSSEAVTAELDRPSVQLPLTFLVEYALAQTLARYGVEPDLFIGHSMGENTAACLAGVATFEETLGLILLRGQLFEKTPAGSMLSIPMPAKELLEYLGEDVDLAIVNSDQLSVASGSVDELESLARRLLADGIDTQKVNIDLAAHSRLLDSILVPFSDHLRSLQLKAPTKPIISNSTGKVLTAEQATDPEYWVSHLRHTVLFGKGVDTLLADDDLVFFEVGPGNMLGSFVRQNQRAPAQRVLSSMRHPNDEIDDDVYLRLALGRLWVLGVDMNCEALWPNPRVTPLPTYPFQHSSYWIEGGIGVTDSQEDALRPMRLEDQTRWFSEPGWVQQGILETNTEPHTWLVIHGQDPISKAALAELRKKGNTVIEVHDGDVFARIDETTYSVAPEAGGEGYQQLIDALVSADQLPDRILHTWLVTLDQSHRAGSTFFHRIQNHGFYSLFYLARAIGKAGLEDHDCHVIVVANNAQRVSEETLEFPTKATALGPCMVIPREFPGITCAFVDLDTGELAGKRAVRISDERVAVLARQLCEETVACSGNRVIAWRNHVRWQRHIRPIARAVESPTASRLRVKGTYLITGGLGGIGTVIGNWLAERYQANLILVGRTPLPDRADWDSWLQSHPVDDSISGAIKKIRHLEALGADVLPLQADVTVADQLQDAIQSAEARFGQIHGVLHAAGTLNDSLIQLKSPREIEAVFSAKVYGTQVLDDAFRERALDFMILFGSTSAYVAPQGQVDYVAANSFLNAFAQARANDRLYPVTTLNWGIWSDVGMVAPAGLENSVVDASRVALLDSQGFFSSHMVHRDGTVEVHELTGAYGADKDWVVDEHRLKSGEALLPGTGYFELIQRAIQELGIEGAIHVTNLIFHAPLFVPDDESRRVRVELRSAPREWQVVVEAEIGGLESATWETCVSANVSIVDDTSADDIDLIAIDKRCSVSEQTTGGSGAIKTRQEDHLRFGPRWRVLRQLKLGDGEALARIQLPDEFAADLAQHPIHPALLDIGTGCAMDLIPGYSEQIVAENLWVPISYRSFTTYAPFEESMCCWLRLSQESDPNQFAIFDVTLADDTGRVIAEVKHLMLSRQETSLGSSAVATEPVVTEAGTPVTTKSSPGEIALAHNLTQGIDSVSGISALKTLLDNPSRPQVIVSSMAIGELLAQTQLVSQSARSDSSTRFDRPELDSDFEAPRDEIEQTLADLWGKLLGVEGVGIHDSFFDLGGHSLVAVRLFNEITDKFGNELPMSVLMQSPMISGLAERIRGHAYNSESVDGDADSATVSTINLEPQYRYVVPINTGPVGGKTPLFIVAGMFGNVLNLGHLADLLGEGKSVV